MAALTFDDIEPQTSTKSGPLTFDDIAPEQAGPPTPDNRYWFQKWSPLEGMSAWDKANPLSMKESLGIPEDMTVENVSGAARNTLDAVSFGLGDMALAAGKARPVVTPDYSEAQSLLKRGDVVGALQAGNRALAAAPSQPGQYPDYDTALAGERAKTQQWAKENPGRATEAQILGALAPGGLVGKAVGGIAKGANLFGKMVAGGAGGAGFGAASEAGHTDTSWADALEAARKGLTEGPTIAGVTIPNYVIGAATPVVGKAIGAAAEFLTPYFQRPAPGMGKAATAVAQSALPSNTAERLSELGPQGTLTDLGPGPMAVTRGVVQRSMGTPLQAGIEQTFADRAAQAPARLQEAIHDNMGVPQNPDLMAKAIRDYGVSVTDPMYQNLWASKPPSVNVKPILEEIRNQYPNAGPSVQKQLDFIYNGLTEKIRGGGTLPKTSAQAIHGLKVDVGDKANFDGTVPQGTVANGALKHYYGQLSDALGDQVPGYRDVTAESKKYFDWVDALKSGTETLGSKNAWPDTFRSTFDAMSPAEQHFVREGMTSKVGQALGAGGTNVKDLPQLSKLVGGDLDWNRANMTTAFGAEPTQNLVNRVGAEQTFANTQSGISGGPRTAPTLAAERALAGAEMPSLGCVDGFDQDECASKSDD